MKMSVSGIDAVIQALKKEKETVKAKAKKQVALSVIDALKKETPVLTGKARDGWQLDEKGNIENAVEYIGELNQGHSPQAPAHFIERTVISIPEAKPNGIIVTYTE